nr:ASCH domain-containing protein [Rhodoferax sp.]
MPAPRVLHLNLKAEYFDQIAGGTKPFEFRLCTPYWSKRLKDQHFDEVHVKKGYPPASDLTRVLVCPWRGVELQTISHPHFGTDPVQVFAIRVSG